jgi:hypothetical protein
MKLSASAKEAVTDVQSKSRKKRPRSRLWPSGSRTRQDRGTEQPDVCQRRTYDHAIREFVACYCSEPRLAFHRTVVLRYRIHLEQRKYAPATINLRLARDPPRRADVLALSLESRPSPR